MTNNLKIAAISGIAALGLASAAVAQQSSPQQPPMTSEQHQQMMSGGMQNGQMMTMMNDPQMRKQMTEMMQSCNRMMQHMGNMSGSDPKPKA